MSDTYVIDAEVSFARPVPEEDQIRAQLESLDWPSATGSRPSLWWPSADRAMVAGHVVVAETWGLARGLSAEFIGERLLRSTSQPVQTVQIVGMHGEDVGERRVWA